MDGDLDERLARYAELVRACPHNLLSPRGLAELTTRHVPESLAFADLLPPDVDLVDVGPGGGLPGMVIALRRPDIRVTLVEATRKKADFLREAAAELHVPVDVRHARIEDLATGEFAGCFGVATARAVANLGTLAAWILPALAPDGELWAIKGERWAEEVDEARGTLLHLGAEVRANPDRPRWSPSPSPVGDGHAQQRPAVVIIGRARANRGDA